MKFLAIVNPRAAGGKPVRLVPKLKKIVSRSAHTYEWKTTRSPAEMQSAIAAAARSGIDGVVVMGGDGTVSYALPALLSAGLPLGIIPSGRGNDFVRNVGLPLKIHDAIAYPERPGIRTIDIPTANGVPYGSVACVGFDARVNELANKPHKYLRGRSVFIYAVMKTLRNFKPFDITVSNDNGTWQGSIMMVAVANGGHYGGGMQIAPMADMQDGLLNICVVRATSKRTLLRAFPGVFTGKHADHPDVTFLLARSITITAATEQNVYADGEYFGKLPLTCSISGHRLRILQPISTE